MNNSAFSMRIISHNFLIDSYSISVNETVPAEWKRIGKETKFGDESTGKKDNGGAGNEYIYFYVFILLRDSKRKK